MASHSARISRERGTLFGLISICILEALIFFSDPNHFFQGDTVFWMANRHESFGEFLQAFVKTDLGGWYRPLTQQPVQSVLFPLAGLNPLPYRIVTFVLFCICTVSVFVFIDRASGLRRASWFGTLFFAMHVTHAYTTYDVAFTPELVYTATYVFSAIAFLSYLRTRRKRALLVSVLLFVISLGSKEAAVTLPFILAMGFWLLPRDLPLPKWILAPYFAVLSAYIAFTLGYLHVAGVDLAGLIRSPERFGVPGYELSLGANMLDNLGTAFYWSFNLPYGPVLWQFGAPWMPIFASSLAVVACIAAINALLGTSWRYVALGIGWFVVACTPMLALLGHFMPYYLLGPLVGFSLAIGVAFDRTYDRLRAFTPRLLPFLAGGIVVVSAVVNAGAARNAALHDSLLGRSAYSNEAAATGSRALYAQLPIGAKLVILNQEPAVAWDHGYGGLIRLLYGNPELDIEYSSLGISTTPGDVRSGRVVVLRASRSGVEDATEEARRNPEILYSMRWNRPYSLRLSKTTVRAGGDAYTLQIPELAGMDVEVIYAYNGLTDGPFRARLDGNGEVGFDVGEETPRGTYDFVAVRPVGGQLWARVDGMIQVE